MTGLNDAIRAAEASTAAGNAPSLLTQTKIALGEAVISTTSSTLTQSALNGDSFLDGLEAQGVNILIATAGNLLAKEIGTLAKTDKLDANGQVVIDSTSGQAMKEIGKTTQLGLHATLGCAMGAAGGGDCASGAEKVSC